MRRKRTLKKIRPSFFVEDFKERIYKRAPTIFLIVLFIVISSMLAKAFFYRSDYFKVKAIEAKDMSTGKSLGSFAASDSLKLYKDKNIFNIDIKRLAKSLRSSMPDAREVIVKRMLPDKLLIELKPRRAVAIISDARYYAVDEDGYIVPDLDAGPSKGLPIIVGIDIGYEEGKGRLPVESRNLKLVLGLLREMKEARFRAEDSVNTIDAGDFNNITFYLKNGLEVRIGHENFSRRIGVLKKMLKDPMFVVDRIRYIDLRFEDVVIGPK